MPKSNAQKKSKELPAKSGGKKELLLKARKRKQTPNIFEGRFKNTPICFTLEDVQKALEEQKLNPTGAAKEEAAPKNPKIAKKTVSKAPEQVQKSSWGAASLSDILGFTPGAKTKSAGTQGREADVPKKHLPFYKALLSLRRRIEEGFTTRTKDHLRNSAENDDSSGYSQHMADAGTDNYDRDLALSIASTEQEELHEIDKAIDRIFKGTYGMCEITGEKISTERLEAVPYTRYSLDGQRQLELQRRRRQETSGIFPESSLEETAKYTEDAID